MSNCGCSNSTPCTSQECGCKFEVDAGCVRYTGDTLSCIDAQTGDLLGDILLELNNKFCDLTSGNFIEVSQEPPGNSCVNGGLKIVVKDINTYAIISTEYLCTAAALGSVTGLNTDNTDPLNPVVRISVDGTTVTGLGTPASPLVASSGIAGSGTNNYVTKWTPDGNTLGDSIIRANADRVAIGQDPDGITAGGTLLYLDNPNGPNGLQVRTTYSTNGSSSITGYALGVGTVVNTGIVGGASGATSINTGISGNATGTSLINRGSSTTASGATTNIGIYAAAQGVVGAKYSAQLVDDTEGIGKVLTCMTSDGKANWVTPATGIAGSGLNNYVARWTPDGNTLGYGTIQDNGLTAGVNGLISNVDFAVGGTTGSSFAFLAEVNAGSIAAIKGYSADPSVTINTAIVAVATNTSTGGAIGGNFNANGLTTGTGDNIGVKVLSEGTLATKYAVQLQDGTEGIGKVLTSVTSDGKANWADANPQKFITYPADFTGTNYTLTSADNGYSIVVINGSTAVTITVPPTLVAKMQVGFIQDGTGDVTFTPSSTLLKNAISGYKIKGQYDQAYLEQGSATNIYYLLGNTKV